MPHPSLLMLLVAMVIGQQDVKPNRSPEPWEGPAFSATGPEIVDALKNKPVAEPAALENLLSEEVYRFDEQGRSVYTRHRVWRCLTEQCIDDHSVEETSWAPWYQERPTIRARVITPDKAIHDLDPQTIFESSVEQQSPLLWSDRKTLQVPLPALRVGAVVEDEVVVRGTQPLFAQGVTSHVPIARAHPTNRLRLTIDAPKSLPLRYEVLGTQAKLVRTESGGRVRLFLELGPLKAVKSAEPCMPSDMLPYPAVVFSTGKSWEEVAAGYTAIVEPRFDVERVRSIVREAVGQETDRQRVIARLLAKVHDQIRYTGLEFGAAALTPRPLAETLTRRYGDCKDHVLLFGSMLRAAGIPAYIALICTGPGADVVPSLPGMGVFDHVIVCIPGTPDLWIDPTDSFSPAGELPAMDRNRWVLVAKPGTKALVRTPPVDHRRNTSTKTVEFFIAESGTSRVRETIVSTGDSSVSNRSAFATQGDVPMRKAWREYGKRFYKSGAVTTLEHSPPRDLEKPFRLTIEIEESRAAEFGSDGALTLVVHPGSLFSGLPRQFTAAESKPEEREPDEEDQVTRKSPLELPSPCIYEVQYRVTPPEGYSPSALPENTVEHYGPATFSAEYRVEKGRIAVATFRLDTGHGRFTAAEVNAMRRGLAKLNSHGQIDNWVVPLTFDHGASSHLAAGRFREALAVFQRLFDQPRTSSRHRLQYAETLLKGGLGTLARRVAREAVAQTPDSAEAYAALARILTHDLVGQRYRPGFDRTGALEAYRRALALAPSDWRVRWDYAILLEVDDHGFRFETGPEDLELATVQFQQIRKAVMGSDELDQQIALLLLRRQRFIELESLARSKRSTSVWNSLLLAAVAAQHPLPAVEAVLASRSASSVDRRNELATAIEYLQTNQRYEQCRMLLGMALPILENDQALRQRFALLSRVRPFAEVRLSETEPSHAVQELYRQAIMTACSAGALRPLFSQDTPDADFLQSRLVLAREIGGAVRGLWQQPSSSEATANILLSNVTFESLGSSSIGWRVRFDSPSPKPLEGWYVVREAGRFRILGNIGTPAVLGRIALRLLSSGEVSAAAKWLDRACAEQTASPNSFLFVGPPFTRLWAEVPHDDLRMLRLTVAAMTAEGTSPDPSNMRVLESCGTEIRTALKSLADRALVKAYLRAGRTEDTLKAAERLPKNSPQPDVEACRFVALCRLGRIDEAQAVARVALERSNDSDADAEEWAFTAAWIGACPEAETRLRRKLQNKTKPFPAVQEATILTHLAWAAMIQGRTDEHTLNDVLQANKLTNYQDQVALHTLAALYAEQGKITEAIKHLHSSLDISLREFGGGDSYYILGRIAEHSGLPDIAAELYQKVSMELATIHVHYAAQKRLAGLKKK